MVIDHVVLLVPDGDAAMCELRERHGLGSERGPYHEFSGTRSHMVPLQPPAYLELLAIENCEAAGRNEAGRRVLACEARGFVLLAWAVLVDDLEAVAARVGIEIFDYTIPYGDGTLRGWRSVTGPEHLPFFIDYPNNGDRIGRLRGMYERVAHTRATHGFRGVTVAGREDELRDWLGPNDLPLRIVDGEPGLHEARIATSTGDIVISSQDQLGVPVRTDRRRPRGRARRPT
jgi:hypothetical protein